jgi:GNAT superfamily N-acetyltransferase
LSALRVISGYPGRMDELTRAFEFERRRLERLSTRLERFEFGVAYLDEEYRQRYFSNFLLADKRSDDASAAALIEAGERILGGAGYDHRLIILRDERRAERIAAAFQAFGFSTSREVTMTYRRDPDRDANLPVEEVPFAEVKSLIQEMYREDPDVPEDIAHLFAEQHGKYERVAGARFFAARVDGRLAGNCELYQRGDDAQVEHVGTLKQFRGRGVARSVILRAVQSARETGARHVFIVTDEDDWPRDLYARLGFDQIGRTWEFLRSPDGGGGVI